MVSESFAKRLHSNGYIRIALISYSFAWILKPFLFFRSIFPHLHMKNRRDTAMKKSSLWPSPQWPHTTHTHTHAHMRNPPHSYPPKIMTNLPLWNHPQWWTDYDQMTYPISIVKDFEGQLTTPMKMRTHSLMWNNDPTIK